MCKYAHQFPLGNCYLQSPHHDNWQNQDYQSSDDDDFHEPSCESLPKQVCTRRTIIVPPTPDSAIAIDDQDNPENDDDTHCPSHHNVLGEQGDDKLDDNSSLNHITTPLSGKKRGIIQIEEDSECERDSPTSC